MPLFGYICRMCRKQAGGRRRKYCDECTEERINNRQIEYNNQRKEIIKNGQHWTKFVKEKSFICAKCGLEFKSFQNKATICKSPECQLAYRVDNIRKAQKSEKWRNGQPRQFATKSDKDRFFTYKRRATIAKQKAEKFPAKDIFERDGWMCGICGLAVNKDLKYPHPYSPSLDHIVPVLLGGEHTRENVQCSHWLCNMRKGKRHKTGQASCLT